MLFLAFTSIFVFSMCVLQHRIRSRCMPRYTGVVVFESLVPFHTTFSSRLASRFLRWKAHTRVFEGFVRSWFVSQQVVIVLRADVSDASMLLKSFPCDAQMKLRVSGCMGWSLVQMLNNIGASTLPCGSPFRCRRQRVFFPFSTTKKRLFSSMVHIRSVSCTSPVISSTLLRRRRWLTVSQAADKSTKTAPVIRRFSQPSSICSVKFSSWLVHDFPGRNPACSGMSFASTCSATRFSMSRSNSLQVWQSREIGRTLFATDGAFPDFSSATTLACLVCSCGDCHQLSTHLCAAVAIATNSVLTCVQLWPLPPTQYTHLCAAVAIAANSVLTCVQLWPLRPTQYSFVCSCGH